MNDHNSPVFRSGLRLPGISVVVPAYRSPGTLESLCDQLEGVLGPLCDEIEIVIVDDGSGDGTWDSIVALATERPHVRGIALLRNFGQHNALLAGIRSARLPLIATIDDDLQNPPSEIPKLLDRLRAGYDLVYGRPCQERQTLLRNIASRGTKRIMAASLGTDVYRRPSAFRVFKRELVSASDGVNDPSISIDVLLSWATNQITDVSVDFDTRASGRSGYTLSRLIRHAFNMITGYSTRPLRWVGFIGTCCATVGFLMLGYVVGRYVFVDSRVEGFTFLAAALTLFSGVQLLSLGVLGEYLGRIHFRTMGKPPYVVRATTPEKSVRLVAKAELSRPHEPEQTPSSGPSTP